MADTRAAAVNEIREAEAKLERLREEASRDPKQQMLVRLEVVGPQDRYSGARKPSGSSGPLWNVEADFVADVVYLLGLYPNMLDEGVDTQRHAVFYCETMIEQQFGWHTRTHYYRREPKWAKRSRERLAAEAD